MTLLYLLRFVRLPNLTFFLLLFKMILVIVPELIGYIGLAMWPASQPFYS
jgi:hypothetical protein